MFQNAYQSGPSVEIFDPKINKEKDKNYANLCKIANHNLVKKVFDKEMKGYIYELDAGVNSKIIFPKDERTDLALLQQYIVFQIFLPHQQSFGIDLMMTDTSKAKRRVNLTTAVSKIDLNFFHVKIPIEIIKRGVWLNLAIDVLTFMDAFKGQTFRSLDGIVINAVCKLRKIFTLRYPPFVFKYEEDEQAEYRDLPNAQDIPKNLNYPAGVPYINQIITYDLIKLLNSERIDNPLPNIINEQQTLNLNPLKTGSNAKFQKPQTTSTPIKDFPMSTSLKKTPNKSSPQVAKQFPFDEESKENTSANKEFSEKNQEFLNAEDSSVFYPMGKAATDLKKNPWSSQPSKKSISSTKTQQKPLEKKIEKKNEPVSFKANKRLDLNALKQTDTKKNSKKEGVPKQNTKNPKEKSPDPNSEEYYEKSSKFNTVTDPRIFAPENLALNKWNSNEEISENGENNEIEENIKENESMRASKQQIKEKKSEKKTFSTFKSPNKKEISSQNNKGEISQEIINTEEIPNNNLESPSFRESQNKGVYEAELDKIIKEEIRPYSPPFETNKKQMDFKQTFGSPEQNIQLDNTNNNMLEVVYDPVLNCYYDPKTNSYYDLKP